MYAGFKNALLLNIMLIMRIKYYVVNGAYGVTESRLTVSVITTVSRGVVIDGVSTSVESELTVSLTELQPAAIDPISVATNAKLKICFFIGF